MVPVRPGVSAPSRPGAAVAGVGPMWRWRRHLVPVDDPVSLGEGGTPLVELTLPDVPARTLLKDERANPTGSFKDRLASAVVSRAAHRGAETIVVSSSGNAGIAVAAYAAAAGLRCVLLAAADPGLPAPTAAAAAAYGARMGLTASHLERWTAAATGVKHLGWFPATNLVSPPVASHPAGVHAYRTIAYEIAESLGWEVPDWVVVPVSRGDGLFGVWAGFAELVELGWTEAVPRMLAVVRFPSLVEALAEGLDQPRPSAIDGLVKARSIGDPQATAMSVHVLRASGGQAVCVGDEQIASAWRRLAAQGVLLEFSSAAVVSGAEVLAERGLVDERSCVVLLGTAGPYAQESLDGAVTARSVVLDDPSDPDSLVAAFQAPEG